MFRFSERLDWPIILALAYMRQRTGLGEKGGGFLAALRISFEGKCGPCGRSLHGFLVVVRETEGTLFLWVISIALRCHG